MVMDGNEERPGSPTGVAPSLGYAWRYALSSLCSGSLVNEGEFDGSGEMGVRKKV